MDVVTRVRGKPQAIVPEWATFRVVRCSKYLCLFLGPGACVHSWEAPISKCQLRAANFAAAGGPPATIASAYNTRAIQTLQYVAQILVPPKAIVKLMNKIRSLTKVLTRLEELFRRDRDKLVSEAIKEELLKKEKNGGGNFGGRTAEITQESLDAKWEIDVVESTKDYPHMIWASKSVRIIYD